MYIVMKVIIPERLSRDQKKLIETLAKTDLEDATIRKFNQFVEKN